MNSMSESGVRNLTWRQTGKLESQLVAGEEVLATLRWAKAWGTLATGESTEGTWTFKRGGLLAPKIIVQTPGSGGSSASMTPRWKGDSAISLPGGQRFRLAPKGFWRSEWVLTDDERKPVMTIKPSFAWGKVEASVEVETGAIAIRELPLLTILCWYAILLVSYDNSDGGGAIMASLVATGSI